LREWKSSIPDWRRYAALGTILAHQWKGKAAARCFGHALDQLPGPDYGRYAAQVHVERSRAWEAAGDYQQEREDAMRALFMYRKLNDSLGEARAGHALANYHHVQDRPYQLELARRWILRSEKAFRRIDRTGDKTDEIEDLGVWLNLTHAEILSKIGRILGRFTPLGKLLLAMASRRIEDKRFRQILSGDIDKEAFVLLSLADIQVSLGNFALAQRCLDDALRRIEWIGNPPGLDHLLRTRGRLHMKRGKMRECENDYNTALRMSSTRYDEPSYIAKDSIALLALFLRQRRWREADCVMKKAWTASRQSQGVMQAITFIVGKIIAYSML
jgi:tetratricopeptide (TPR) repeat protein